MDYEAHRVSSDGSVLNRAGRLAHVDALRAFAVMLVVVMHAGAVKLPGDGGVTVFFCISGYIISTLLLKERRRSNGFDALGFYWRRFLKLAPPLLVIIVLPTAIYALFKPVDLLAAVAQVFFGYNWVQVWDSSAAYSILPGSTVVWSLAVEEQFYIVFALFWLWFVQSTYSLRHLAAGAAVVAAASLLVRVALGLRDPESMHLAHGTDARIEAIAFGILVAVAMEAYSNGRFRWLEPLGSPLGVLGGLAIFASASVLLNGGWVEPVFRPTLQAIGASIALSSGLIGSTGPLARLYARAISLRPIQVIGLASYSIYMCHFVLMKLMESQTDELNVVLRVTLNSLLGIVAGIAIYKLLEVPMQRYKGLVAGRPKPSTPRGSNAVEPVTGDRTTTT